MTKYYFKDDAFVIEDYDQQKAFASFLPGIAGKRGIPLWAHYTNKAQCITSFGLRDKNGCILEFYPANTAYRIIDKLGFRTFIKYNDKVYEIFKPNEKNVQRKMLIYKEKISIEEINEELNLKVKITYFNLPQENIAGLVRRVDIINLDNVKKEITILDGLTQLLPTDSNEWMLKHQSNLLKSWNEVELLDDKIAFYFLNSIPADEAEVNKSEYGNYYVSLYNNHIIKPIYDVNVFFGNDTTLSNPINLESLSYELLREMPNYAADKVSGGFSLLKEELTDIIHLDTVIGYTPNRDFILNKINDFMEASYFDQKEKEAGLEISNLTSDVHTLTSNPLFDNYMEQNYLDNLLRGGYPYIIKAGDKKFVYHLFSRRHGDMEREYNFYSIAAEYYSQGNGNFRDVAQNRRSDSLFHKDVGIYNAYVFCNLIQLDGYNPLGVNGSTFSLKEEIANKLNHELFNDNEVMGQIFKAKFTPGLIVNTMEKQGIKLKMSDEELFAIIFKDATQNIEADFGEGYWSDHWTYTLDLIENALKVYPEKLNEYLYEDATYKFYSSPVTVLPRSEKYCLNKHNHVRQYGAILDKDEEKITKCKMNIHTSNFVKDEKGNEITTNMFGKLLTLVVNKFSILDPLGIGVSMEGNKPGWNDAMNGLPGLFGSGVSETIELARIVNFLLASLGDFKTLLPIELKEHIDHILDIYQANNDKFIIWDKVTTSLEDFRAKTRFNISKMESYNTNDFEGLLLLIKKTLDEGINKAFEIGEGILPTFLTYEAVNYEETGHIGHYGLPTVKVNEFKLKPLPYFLEAPARSMKYLKDQELLRMQYLKAKQTALYDPKLHMYKTSVDLDNESFEIGRVRAFQKGWLERESNFLHMTYKYLLGLLKAGLYKEFYDEIKTNYVCFISPEMYGRSTLENSSFVATSNNPDPAVHGTGFVARLSGSTAEMLSMWNTLFFGDHLFILEGGVLKFNPEPAIDYSFFKDDKVEVTLLSNIKVIYHASESTFNKEVKMYVLDNKEYKEIKGDLAKDLREGKYKQIDIYF